ncbi:MAG TPA: hypothetical protein VNE63_23835 [Candidatus Acidoferrales bacterium]|nr:hypothetical protein [Candidatus Acidoferrales bacterium]
MKMEDSETDQRAEKRLRVGLLARATILILLFSVAGLATLAKDGQYFPKTNPARYVSISTKMNVALSPVLSAGEPLQPVVASFPPQPAMRVNRVEIPQAPPIERIGVRVAMQHRSPPLFLA